MRSPEAPDASPLRRWWWAVQLVVFAGVSLWALAFWARLPSKRVSDDDYRAAVDHLSREARPGDAVMLFPWWTDRARLFLPPELPLFGYLDGDDDPLLHHPRIWVLAQPNLPRADADGFWGAFSPGRTKVGETKSFGNLELTLFENGRHRPAVFQASQALAGAHAYLQQPNGARAACSRLGDRLSCPPQGPSEPLYVRTEWHEVLYEPRRCVYFVAPRNGMPMSVEFPRAPLGAELLFEAGIAWEQAFRKDAPYQTTFVTLEDAESNERLSEIAIPAGLEGFQRAVIPNAGRERALRVTVKSNSAVNRWVCLDVTGFAAASEAR